jgi:FkbM family methyltransferase
MIKQLIYDVGMNNGDDTAYYLARGYRVVAVDADPMLIEHAAKRFEREITEGRLTLLNIGIAEEPGELPFWICDSHSHWNSFHRDIAARDGSAHHPITIPTRCFRSVLEEYGTPYYLKVDIEGNDLMCLRDLSRRDLPAYVSWEYPALEGMAVLRDLGYTRFKCISQRCNFLPLELPPSRDQRRYERLVRFAYSQKPIPRAIRELMGLPRIQRQFAKVRTTRGWTFPAGSSGPFGKDLRGRWQSFEEMTTTYNEFAKRMEERQESIFWGEAEYSFWTDIHARLGA